MDEEKKSEDSKNILKCGKRTYFFDVKQARNGNNYLKVTESRFVKEGEPRKRNVITLFKDDVEGFTKMLAGATQDL